MKPRVSVIIPFYSHKEWLEETLESVFNQTFSDYEVILVNDGSKEDIEDLLLKYQGRLSYFKQENQGPAAARNFGIRVAMGDFVAFEDSDDVWLPTKLEKQIPFMEKNDIVWSHTGYYYWWPETDKKKVIDVSKDYGDIYYQKFISIKIATPSVIIKRDFLLQNNLFFPEKYRNGEDSEMWGQLAKIQPLGLIQEPLVKVRMRGSNSYSHAIERFNIGADVYKRMIKEKLDVPKGIIRVKKIYFLYSKLFKGRATPIKEFIAKCLWTVPYSIERIYVKQLAKNSNKQENYILRYP